MGTFGSPIAFALRDVGAGFGELLKSEAERRDAGLRREVALGQLGIQKAQVEAQGQQNLAQLGIQQAQVGSQQREFEARQELAERQLQHQQFRDLKADTLAQGQLGVAEASQLATERYQGRTATVAEAAQRSQAEVNTAQARSLGFAGDYAEQHTRQLKALNDLTAETTAAGEQLVDPAVVLNTAYEGWKRAHGEPVANALRTQALAFVSANSMPGELEQGSDPATGKSRVPLRLLQQRMQAYGSIVNDMAKFGGKMTDPELIKTILGTYEKAPLADQQQGMGMYLVKNLAIARNPEQAAAELQRIDQEAYTQGVVSPANPKGLSLKAAALERMDADKVPRNEANIKRYMNEVAAVVESQRTQALLGMLSPVQRTAIQAVTAPVAAPTTAPVAAGQEQTRLEAFTGQAAQAVGLRPVEAQALFRVESNFQNVPNAQYGPRSGTGPGQLVASTFRQYAKPGEDINNPEDNIRVGIRYLVALKQHYGGDLRRAYAAYNAGPGNVPKEGPIPQRVQVEDITVYPAAFADKVIANLGEQPGLYGRTLPPAFANTPATLVRGARTVYKAISEGGTSPPPPRQGLPPGLAGAGLSEADRYLLSR
jgi:soluble lytic murein transglycosylase-like protein